MEKRGEGRGFIIFIIVIMSLFTIATHGQAITDMEQAVLFKQRLDPSLIEEGRPHFAILRGEGTFNMGVDTQWDGRCNCMQGTEKFHAGAYFSFTDDDFQSTFYLTKDAGRFTGTLFAGMYDVTDRSATFGGFSLLYHHKYGAFGIKVTDLFDVPLHNNSEAAFFEFEQMTPEFVFEQDLFTMGDTTYKVYGAVSYQDINSFEHSWAFEADHKNASFGYGFNRLGENFGYAKAKFNRMAAFVSLGGRGYSVGFTANFK